MKFKDYPNASDGTSKVDAIPNEAPDIPGVPPSRDFLLSETYSRRTNYRIEFN
jgi:hypothetical protein